MTLQWISTRDGIMRMFAELKARLEKKTQKEENGKEIIEGEGEKVKGNKVENEAKKENKGS